MKKIILLIALAIPTLAFGDTGYEQQQDGTIQFFEELQIAIDGTIKEDKDLSKLEPKDKYIHHLTGIYLYCTLKNGVCPLILDSLLELDIINSQIEGKPTCPIMLSFWKKWIANGLEKRVDYSLSTGFIKKRFEFKQNVRPKYLKCSGTVTERVKPDLDLRTFIKERYVQGSEQRQNLEKLISYLKAVKETVDDVFVKTGAYK